LTEALVASRKNPPRQASIVDLQSWSVRFTIQVIYVIASSSRLNPH